MIGINHTRNFNSRKDMVLWLLGRMVTS